MPYQDVVDFLKQVGPVITVGTALVGVCGGCLVWRDRNLQRLKTYVDLEFEASRIFRVCIDRPEIITYLEARSENKPPDVEERAYWYVCQVLNTFELLISFQARNLVAKDVFKTWIAWFYELGFSKRFEDYWENRYLNQHYKADLRNVMDLAQKMLKERSENYDEARELQAFHAEVARLLDRSKWRRFRIGMQARKGRSVPA